MLNYIPLIVIILGLAIMAIFLLRKKGSGHKSREDKVKEMGWYYEKGNSVYTVGENPESATLKFKVKGIINEKSWVMESHIFFQISNKTYNPLSIFRYEKELIGNNYFFAVPNLNPNTKADYLAYLPRINVNNILEKFNIDIALVEKLKLSKTRNDFFNKNFYIYTSDDNTPDSVTSKDTSYYLTNLTNKIIDPGKWPLIAITPHFLELKVLWTIEKPEDIKAFAELGIAIIKNI